MIRMFEMYRQDNKDAEFKFLYVFTRIEKCEKWAEVRLNLGLLNQDERASIGGSMGSLLTK